MKLSLEQKAVAWALLASALSLAGTWLVAEPIQAMTTREAAAPPPAAMAVPPELLAQGSEFFGQSCSDCHGDDARGDEGPDLHNLTISNARIAAQIRNGEKGEMPSFAKKYNDQQVAAIVSYLRTLR